MIIKIHHYHFDIDLDDCSLMGIKMSVFFYIYSDVMTHIQCFFFFLIIVLWYHCKNSSEATATDSPCEESQQCSSTFQNSECKDTKCKCLSGFVQNTNKDKCLVGKCTR